MSKFTPETILKLAREDTRNLEIISICMEEIKLRAMAELPNGGQILRRYQAAKKYIKDIDENRPALKGSWPLTYQGKEGCQALCNAFTGIILYKPLEGLPEAVTNGEPLKLAELMPGAPDDYVEAEVDLAAAITMAKTVKEDNKPVFAIGQQNFDPRLVVQAAAILGTDITFMVSPKDDYLGMYVQNDNGVAFVLPLRK